MQDVLLDIELPGLLVHDFFAAILSRQSFFHRALNSCPDDRTYLFLLCKGRTWQGRAWKGRAGQPIHPVSSESGGNTDEKLQMLLCSCLRHFISSELSALKKCSDIGDLDLTIKHTNVYQNIHFY